MRKNVTKRVLVGLSGGVDSAASVLLLQKEGCYVEGAFLHLLDDRSQMQEAEEMAERLRIPLHILDLRQYFEDEIIRYFIDSFQKGETPNPCIVCNQQIKFGKMLNFALKNGFDSIATGHYARIVHAKNDSLIYKACNKEKDQSYLLYTLRAHQRKHILFPLGEMENKDIPRRILKENGISLYSKRESQDICFIQGDYREFLNRRGYRAKKGLFVDEDGKTLGEHRGIAYYTVGQRRGLGISASTPLFVKEIQSKTGNIVLSRAASLMHSVIYADNVHFFEDVPGGKVEAKIRYSAAVAPCFLSLEREKLRIEFISPVRAPAPGQSVVFYKEDRLLGGGIILKL